MIIPDRVTIMLRSAHRIGRNYFGEIDEAIIRLNEAGQMIDQEWNQIPKR